MILQDIINEINEKCPNGLTTDSIVRKINNLQKKLFRTIVKRTVTTSIDLIKDQALYPITFSASKIREVLVNGTRYEYRQLEGDAISQFFYVLDNAIGIYPTPSQNYTAGMLIYSYEEPRELSSGSLGDTPDLDEDFHSLLIYGTCKEVAEVSQRYDLVNGFIAQYNAELDIYNDANQDTEPAQIQEESWW